MSLRNPMRFEGNRIFWEIHANGNCPHSIAIASQTLSMQTVNFSFTSFPVTIIFMTAEISWNFFRGFQIQFDVMDFSHSISQIFLFFSEDLICYLTVVEVEIL